MSLWLSLNVSAQALSSRTVPKAGVFVSVPKKVVRLAVERNRVRRLLKEAVRREAGYRKDKTYSFKVLKRPDSMTFATVQEAVRKLGIGFEDA